MIHPLLKAHCKMRIDELSHFHWNVLKQLEAEKEQKKLLQTKGWWEIPIDQIKVEELHHMHASLDEFEQSLTDQNFHTTGGDPGAFLS